MAIDPIVITALALTMLGAMVRGLTLHAWPPPLALTSPPSSHSFTQGTSLGALLVVLHPHMSFRRLGELQGLAAGLMLSISVFDLYQESEEAVGRFWATTCFYAGVVFFAVIVVFIPDPDSASIIIPDEEEEEKEKVGPTRKEIIPSSTPEKVRPHPNITTRSALKQRKAIEALEEEVPPATPFNQLNEKKKGNKGKPSSAKASSEREKTREAKKRVLMSGLITAVGIALHNFPEGVAVFLASFKSAKIGASIAFAIALHNIPEGVAVALPVYFATGSRWKGFKYAFVSGLAEPAAVVLLGLFLPKDLLSKSVIDCLLAAVGGIMAFLALSELLPLAIEHAGRHRACAALFIGMAVMSLNLYVLEEYLAHGH